MVDPSEARVRHHIHTHATSPTEETEFLEMLGLGHTSISTDVFGHPIHTGDTVIATVSSRTSSPVLVQARTTGVTPSGRLAMTITRVGRGPSAVCVGTAITRASDRVRVLAAGVLDELRADAALTARP